VGKGEGFYLPACHKPNVGSNPKKDTIQMIETLRQKRLFSNREFELTDQELSIKSFSPKEKKEFTIKLDTLGQEIYYQSDPPTIKNIIAAICGLVPVAITIAYFFAKEPPDSATTVVNLVIWTPMALILFLSKGKNDVHIIGGQNTATFFRDIPNIETVDNFVKKVIDKSKECIYKKYAKVDTDLPEEQQMSTFHWLYSRDIISETEYERLKQEYKTKKIF